MKAKELLPPQMFIRYINDTDVGEEYHQAAPSMEGLCGSMTFGDKATIGVYKLIETRKVSVAIVTKP